MLKGCITNYQIKCMGKWNCMCIHSTTIKGDSHEMGGVQHVCCKHIFSPWWVYADDISGCRTQLGCSLSVEQHQHTSASFRERVAVLVGLSGRLVVFTVHQLHSALLLNLQHLQLQHARPVHWRAKQQQHRCWVCVCFTAQAFCVCVCVRSVLVDLCSLWDSLCVMRVIHFYHQNNSHCITVKLLLTEAEGDMKCDKSQGVSV